MKKYSLFIFIVLLSLSACGQKNIEKPDEVIPDDPIVEKENEAEVEEEISLKDFFMEDGTIVEFEGKGNEFAELTQETEWINDKYVNIYEDNGGTTVLYTFRLEDDSISVIRREAEMYDKDEATPEELDELTPLYIYLQLPLEKGEKFDQWEVIEDHAIVDTPYETFEDVIVIEKDEDDMITRLYIAKGFGQIKIENDMPNESMNITSTIKNIKN